MILPTLSTFKTIALVGGVLVFALSFLSTEIGLFILIFSMLLSPEFVVGATEGAALGRGITLRADDFLLLILGVSWLAKMAVHKDLGLFLRTPLNKAIAYYIIICFVSTLLGAVFGRVNLKTGFFFVLKYFEYMIVYFMVVNHIEHKSQARKYLWAMLITCAIVSIIAMVQIPLGGRVTAPFEGEAGEPNTLGGYLVLMMSVVIGLLLTTKSFRDQLIYLILIVLFLIPFIFTQSRSSYASMIPAVLLFLKLSEKRLWVFLIILVLGISLPVLAPKIATERLRYTFEQGQRRTDVISVGGIKLDTSTSARLFSIRAASKDWIKHPVLGFGVTGYRFLDAQYFKIITETGFLGLAFFFLLMRSIYGQAREVHRNTTDSFEKGLSMGFLAGFLGLLFHAIGANTFIIVRIMEPFWFLTAMVVMSPQLKEDESKKS